MTTQQPDQARPDERKIKGKRMLALGTTQTRATLMELAEMTSVDTSEPEPERDERVEEIRHAAGGSTWFDAVKQREAINYLLAKIDEAREQIDHFCKLACKYHKEWSEVSQQLEAAKAEARGWMRNAEANQQARKNLQAENETLKKRVGELEEDVLVLKLAWGDCYDAMDYAASTGFQWPSDPVTVNVKDAKARFAVSCPPQPERSMNE